MERQDLTEWLASCAGPSVRYRALVDLQDEQDVGVVGRALDQMISSSSVQDWLTRFHRRFDLNSLHSSRSDAFENIMGKCVLLGLRAGLQPFDSMTIPFRNWLADSRRKAPEAPHSVFLRALVASFLAYAGYVRTEPMQAQMSTRLEALHSFAGKPDFDSVFVDRRSFSGVPKSNHGLVNPDLYPDQEFRLPWIHDIRGLAFSRSTMSAKDQNKLDIITSMILTEEYQSLPLSYGLAKYGSRFYVIGWKVHLPGYHRRPEGRDFAELLLALEFMAKLPIARRSAWFKTNIAYLESFRTDDGTYLFPRGWLPEQSIGYWVRGMRMALDDRKLPNALEYESTFWALRIKRLTEKP